jgi:hypothetical protein
LLNLGRLELGFGLRHIGLGGIAGGAADLGLGACGFFLAARDETSGAQLGLSFCLFFRVDRSNANFLATFAGQHNLRLRQGGLRLLVVVPQLEQQLAPS